MGIHGINIHEIIDLISEDPTLLSTGNNII